MTKPYFDIHVFCCVNERKPGHSRGCCKEKGSDKLRDYMKTKAKTLGKNVRINQAGCLDRCEEGPVMVVYPEGVWYSYNSKDDVDEIVESHLKNGQAVSRLKI